MDSAGASRRGAAHGARRSPPAQRACTHCRGVAAVAAAAIVATAIVLRENRIYYIDATTDDTTRKE